MDRVLYRVWNEVRGPAARGRRAYFCVSTPEEGCRVIESLRRSRRYEVFRSSVDEFGLEFLSDRGWREWHDREGLDVMGRGGEDGASLEGHATGIERLAA